MRTLACLCWVTRNRQFDKQVVEQHLRSNNYPKRSLAAVRAKEESLLLGDRINNQTYTVRQRKECSLCRTIRAAEEYANARVAMVPAQHHLPGTAVWPSSLPYFRCHQH